MTTVACGKCGRPGMLCQCPEETERGSLFGIASGGYAKWSPKTTGEPLTMERIQRAWDLLENQRRSWTKRCPMCGPVPEGHFHLVSPELYRRLEPATATLVLKHPAYTAKMTGVLAPVEPE